MRSLVEAARLDQERRILEATPRDFVFREKRWAQPTNISRSDGICACRGCIERPGALTENIEVQGSHCGLGHHPAAVYAIADRLAQPEGQWAKFHRRGWRALLYPDPAR